MTRVVSTEISFRSKDLEPSVVFAEPPNTHTHVTMTFDVPSSVNNYKDEKENEILHRTL